MLLQDVADACSDAMVSLCLPGPLSLGGSSAEVTAVYQQIVLAALQPHRHNPMTPKLKVGSARARARLFGSPCLTLLHQGGLLRARCNHLLEQCQPKPCGRLCCLSGPWRWDCCNPLATVLLLPIWNCVCDMLSDSLHLRCGCCLLGTALVV